MRPKRSGSGLGAGARFRVFPSMLWALVATQCYRGTTLPFFLLQREPGCPKVP